jgi:cell division transport system ATP-binding protein
MIIFDKVCKSYDENIVLHNVNLKIEAGEFVSVIGASGAGKSTIFHLLMGADTPTSGKITIDGIDLSKLDSTALQLYRRKVGMVWQSFKLLPKKTVFENVAFALEAVDESDPEILLKVDKILDMVGLTKMAYKFPAQLSGGERQRCAIARALVHNPNLIIADEPTGNLDPKTSLEIIKIFKQINKAGVTVILATHDMHIVDEIHERVIEIRGGRVQRDDKKGKYLS